MKNIFIEGIPGMGKSTFLNHIARQKPEYHTCREGDYSPFDLAWCTWMTAEEYAQIIKKYQPLREEIIRNTTNEGNRFVVSYTKIITDIPNFHRDLEQYEIYRSAKPLHEFKEIIFTRYANFSQTGYLTECSFFQNVIEDLILFYLLDDDEIVEFYRELYSKMQRENFLLLYLYSDELEKHINYIKKERCDNHGRELWYPMMLEYLMHSPYGKQHGYNDFSDILSHFRHRQCLELRIIDEIIGEQAVILPAKNWSMEDIVADI